MLEQGLNCDAIRAKTGLSKGRISQIKKEAEERGWLDQKGKLTPDGLRFVYGGEED
jgi:hypothetical protein